MWERITHPHRRLVENRDFPLAIPMEGKIQRIHPISRDKSPHATSSTVPNPHDKL